MDLNQFSLGTSSLLSEMIMKAIRDDFDVKNITSMRSDSVAPKPVF